MRNSTRAAIVLLIGFSIMAVLLFASPPKAPTVPLAANAHEGVLATLHWRLVAERDYDGRVVRRVPLNTIKYKDPNACAADGSKGEGPPRGDDLNSFLIRCLPYHDGEDTDTETPIN